MNKIKILYDPVFLIDKKNGNVYRDIEEYPKAYKEIKNSILSNNSNQYVFQNLQIFNWIKGINTFDPGNILSFSEISIKDLLGDNWGNILIPKYLSDKELKLILKKIPLPKIVSDFENIIIHHYTGILLEENFFNDISNWINKFPYKKFSELINESIFKKVWLNKRDELLTKNKNIQDIIYLFFENPYKFRLLIISYNLLFSYSIQLKKRFCGEYIDSLSTLRNLNLIKVEFSKKEIASIQNVIAIEINSLLKNSQTINEFTEILKSTSGVLENELELLINFLKVKRNINTIEVREQIQNKYRELLKNNIKLSNDFELLNAPKYPSDPSTLIDIPKLIKWAKNEYFPYKLWLNKQNFSDKNIENYSIIYSDFLYKNYIDIIFSYPNVMWKMVPNIKIEVDKQNFTLLLVIDNLTFNYLDDIISFFKEMDASLIEKKEYIASAPTETKFSKTALFSSNYQYENREQNYRNIFNKKMKEYFPNKNIYYTTEINTINNLDSSIDFIVINYGEIDEYLHKDQTKMARNRDEKIRDELRAFFTKIWHVLENKPNADIYITSDHGSLKVTQDNYSLVDQDLIEGKYNEISERVMTVTKKEINKSEEIFNSYGYILKKEIFSLDNDYIIAKGYSSFKPIKGEYYVHGGLTPDETIVPFIHFRKTKFKLIEPNVILENTHFRYNVKSSLIFIIENANDISLENFSIEIISDIISASTVNKKINKVNPLGTKKIIFEGVKILNKKKQNNDIEINVQYTAYGKGFANSFAIPIKLNSIQENTFDIDDFDF